MPSYCRTTSGATDRQLRAAARADGAIRLVVGAVIMREGRTLLLRRRQYDFMGGMYELPSGAVEAGETLGQALAREVFEETGLRMAGRPSYLGYFDYRSGGGRATRQFNFLTPVAAPCNIRLTEHDEYLWACREAMAGLAISDQTRQTIDSASQEAGVSQ